MNMLHGTVKVVAGSADGPRTTTALLEAPARVDASGPVDVAGLVAEHGDLEAAEHATEIADLRRRVIVGAVLTLPVFLSLMAHAVFASMWVSPLFTAPSFQFLLTTPVLFYTGWQIHRTGWLPLTHRAPTIHSAIPPT